MRYDEHGVVAEIRRLTIRELRMWVREGWMKPSAGKEGPVFDELDVARARLICELKQDMGIRNDVLPVVLSLIDSLHQTRRDLQRLTQALEDQPPEVKRAVIDRFRRLEEDHGETG